MVKYRNVLRWDGQGCSSSLVRRCLAAAPRQRAAAQSGFFVNLSFFESRVESQN